MGVSDMDGIAENIVLELEALWHVGSQCLDLGNGFWCDVQWTQVFCKVNLDILNK